MNRLDNARITLPENVNNIIQALMDNGYEAYAVGGCVRDSLINREPGDWDITTSALPYQVKDIFRRTIDTGIVHGTVTVMIGKEGYEVTTYRIDGDYEDGRHPKSVEFTSNLLEDLKRRDFTINAMAYNEVEGIVDAFDGCGDIERRVIRCVGNAMDRFNEDTLRILRAIRFSAQLGYAIEDETKEAITKLSPNLSKISKERIHTELNKMLKSKNPDYFMLADKLGIMQVIMPEFARLSDDQKDFAARLAKECTCELPEKYAAMLLDASGRNGKETARIIRELKMDNDTINMASMLVDNSSLLLTTDEVKLRHIMNKITGEKIERVLAFKIAYEKVRGDEASINLSKAMLDECRAILKRGDCISLKTLAITGNDLIRAGVGAGKEIGQMLGYLLDIVLDDPTKNNYEYLYNIVIKELKNEHN